LMGDMGEILFCTALKSYSIMLQIPFTTEQFFQTFQIYNQSVVPISILFILLGVLVVAALHRKMNWRHQYIGYFLSILWLWIGIVYHIVIFTKINTTAYGFGGLFIMQGLFFLKETYQGRLQFGYLQRSRYKVGMGLVLFSLAIYPILSFFLKLDIDQVISLGLPGPSVIFTFGCLLLIEKFLPKYLLVIPVLWSMIGMSAAYNFGVYPDYLLGLSALVTIYFWTVEDLVHVQFS